MARMTAARVRSTVLELQSARVGLTELVMRQRGEPSAGRGRLGHIRLRLRIGLAHLRLRRAVRRASQLYADVT